LFTGDKFYTDKRSLLFTGDKFYTRKKWIM
jgi:hypothetical protein